MFNHTLAVAPLPPARNLVDTPQVLQPTFNASLKDLTSIVTKIVGIAIPIAGLILFILIIVSGFNLMTSANNPEQAEKAKQSLTSAIVGFLIIFAAYWIAQVLQVVFGVPIVTQQ